MLRNNLFAHLAKYLALTKVITLNDCKKNCRNLYDIFVTGIYEYLLQTQVWWEDVYSRCREICWNNEEEEETSQENTLFPLRQMGHSTQGELSLS